MRLPNAVHEERPWVIAQIAPDFQLLDVWALPATGGPDEFPSLLELIASLDPAKADSHVTRALFALRYRIGGWLGWDDGRERAVSDRGETTLSARLPVNLQGGASATNLSATDFSPLYRTDDEWAAEISNRTVHGVVQLAWVEEGKGMYRGRMAVYVKPRGTLGEGYMALIGPFRHHIVYPALMRQIGRAWEHRQPKA